MPGGQARAVIAKPAVTAAFSPTDVTGLRMWFDASDASSFTYSSGVVVSQWNDKSGNALHATQSTVANQPSRNGTVNSLTTVVFDGTNDYLSVAAHNLAVTHTTFVVAKNAAASTQRTAFRANTGGDSRTYRTAGGNIAFYDGTVVDSGSAWGTTNPQLVAAIFDGNTSSNSLYAINSGSWTSMNPGNLVNTNSSASIGSASASSSAEPWSGDVCEIIVYDNALGSTDRDNVRTYLKNKWNTA